MTKKKELAEDLGEANERLVALEEQVASLKREAAEDNESIVALQKGIDELSEENLALLGRACCASEPLQQAWDALELEQGNEKSVIRIQARLAQAAIDTYRETVERAGRGERITTE